MKIDKRQSSLLIRLRLERRVNADISTRLSLVEIAGVALASSKFASFTHMCYNIKGVKIETHTGMNREEHQNNRGESLLGLLTIVVTVAVMWGFYEAFGCPPLW